MTTLRSSPCGRSRRGRDFTGGDAIGPVGEQAKEARLADVVDRGEHLRAGLAGLNATLPRRGARPDFAIRLGNLARAACAELVTGQCSRRT